MVLFLAIFALTLPPQARTVTFHKPFLQLHCAGAELSVRGDHHGQDERRNNAEAIQDLPLGHGCEQGVAVKLALMGLHQGIRLLAGAFWARRTALVRKLDLALEVRFAGGVHCRDVEPNLLARCGVQDGAVQAKSMPVHHGIPQFLQLLVEFSQLGFTLVDGEPGSRPQVLEYLPCPLGF